MLRTTRFIYSLLLAGAIASAGKPLAAATVAECYEKVLAMCSEAMDGARFYEKYALGLYCTAMLIGCNTSIAIK